MAKVVMYTKDPCPYCSNAKRLLENKKVAFEEIDLTDNMTEMQRIKDETGWRTFPIIMINDKLIGGYQDLKALDVTGDLDKLLV